MPENYLTVSKKHFSNLPLELRVRVTEYLISSITCITKNISLKSIEKIATEIPKYATLNGCQWVIKKDTIFVVLEPKFLPQKLKLKPMKWSVWGNYLALSSTECVIQHQAPKPRIKDIPYLVQRTFPFVASNVTIHFVNSQRKTQKELEKHFNLDYKNHKRVVYLLWSDKGVKL